ncbi:threonine--tRNA ligase [Candidatus Nitrososphaera gargensis Ga9.2]|uniref:Threonine--tRNA ligase n=1 Tax=Nitrososphaera gargensis (strain Ga9.2) TaxID=1237085 RepID=K0ILD5_NITGG|nr:threonine--tRNA ligase [Candidatus Nitrososphaera gargensis]AFU60338.1 threonine--tRNA ligase [Candidatus Nitrososphaera gargensis Ga9.2]
MRLLQLHSDFIEYEPIEKEIRDAEDITSKSKVRLEDLVVAFVAVENGDDESIAKAAVDEIKKYLDTVKSGRLLVYPYAHLSSDLAPPGVAAGIIKSVESFAKGSSIGQVYRAPFGWTKSFNIKVKGHPLAENAKEISRQADHEHVGHSHGEKESTALKAEEKLQSFWFILQPGGTMTPMSEYRFKKQDQNLQVLANYEMAKKRTVDEQPAHVRLMKKLAIADYEPASDAGNMRYYPKGRLMKSLIEQYVTRRVMEYGGIEVETPIMYDTKHPSMESYFNRFPARQYNITSDSKQLFLRFAACFGQFLMAKDFNISYKHLPVKLYELTRYSFRREKSGELVGLRRLRAFTMPDCHALCRDLDQAKQEFRKRFELSISVLQALGLSTEDVEMAIRFTEDFYNENKEFITELIDRFGKPVIAEMWKERFFYFTLKWEFNYVDGLGKASALSTDQIDVENGKRYNIEFVEEDGSKKNPIILHNSPSGAVERVMYALLEKAANVSKAGGIPSFPLWLSHTQVRVIPVGKEHTEYCEKVLAELSANQIRADIDDRDETVGKKIRESETEWIRYTVVIGDKEISAGKLVVRDRNEGKQREMTLQELVDEVKAQTKDKPYLPLNLPTHLSTRPQIMV